MRMAPTPYSMALLIAGLATLTAVGLSLHLINSHLRSYYKPQRQRYIIRILWMVPIYALDSFLSLCFIPLAPVFEVPRDAYEAYVLYNFVALMIDCCGGESDARAFFATATPQKHWFPFGWLGEHDMTVFLETTRLCVLQYSVIRPVNAILTLVFYFSSVGYDDQNLSPTTSSYLWIMLINNASVTLALYYLIYFYHAALPCEPLQQCRPLAKFLAVKAVVFFCFWQYTVIALLGAVGVIDRDLAHKSKRSTQTGLTDFIVCLEMALFAAVHECVFTASEHRWKQTSPSAQQQQQQHSGSKDSPTVTPLHRDVRGVSMSFPSSTHLAAAMPYELAFRDMFFIGDVVSDLRRLCTEAPGVLYLGFSQVNAARIQRRDLRRQRIEERNHRRENPDYDDDDDNFELPAGHRTTPTKQPGDDSPPWGHIAPAPARAPQRQDSPLDKWWNAV